MVQTGHSSGEQAGSSSYLSNVKWKIYYSDHTKEHDTSVNSEQLTPFGIDRRDDIQVIVQESADHGWVTLSGYDYYIWDARGGDAKWFGVDLFGLYHYLLQPGYKCTLFGVMLDKVRFGEIFNLAREDMNFTQPKEAFATNERHP
jgi:hypothetical protein